MPRITENLLYEDVISGELAGSTSATQGPDRKCNAVQFVAASSNTGSIYIGGPGVTKPDGVTDTTTGVELQPGDPLQFIPIRNLNKIYYICDNATDDLVYLAMI